MSGSEMLYAFVQKALFRRATRTYHFLYRIYKALSDRNERAFAKQYIKPGMTVVDVGANIGIYTSFFANLVGKNGKVHAFEPDQVNCDMHARFVKSDNVVLVHKAVAETNQDLVLFASPSLNVDHRTYDPGDGRNETRIQAVALDNYFSPGTRIDFIKMDIQGYEYYALRGANRVLTENHAIRLMFEYYPEGLDRSGGGATLLFDYLQGMGFCLYRDSSRGLLKVKDINALDDVVSYTNLYAMR